MAVCCLGKIFLILDAPLLLFRNVVSALSLSETWQAAARVDEIRQYLINYLDGKGF
jgi:hypothetical protein